MKMSIRVAYICALLLPGVQGTRRFKWTVTEQDTVLDSEPVEVAAGGASRGSCAARCGHVADCRSFAHAAASGTCILYGTDQMTEPQLARPAPGFTYSQLTGCDAVECEGAECGNKQGRWSAFSDWSACDCTEKQFRARSCLHHMCCDGGPSTEVRHCPLSTNFTPWECDCQSSLKLKRSRTCVDGTGSCVDQCPLTPLAQYGDDCPLSGDTQWRLVGSFTVGGIEHTSECCDWGTGLASDVYTRTVSSAACGGGELVQYQKMPREPDEACDGGALQMCNVQIATVRAEKYCREQVDWMPAIVKDAAIASCVPLAIPVFLVA